MSSSDQFQIGDLVEYLPEGVLTRIEGYLWSRITPLEFEHFESELPKIRLYRLTCGISVPRHTIERPTII